MPASFSLLLLLLLCFALFIVRWQSVLLHSKKTKTKQDTFPFVAHATQNFPLHSPLPLSFTPSPSLCLSAKNSCKLFINALERNFLLSERSLSLDLALSRSFSLSAVQTPQQSRVNFLFAVFQFHNIPKRPCAQLTLTKTLWGLLLRCTLSKQQQHPLSTSMCLECNRAAFVADAALLLALCALAVVVVTQFAVYSFLFCSFLVIVLQQ